MPTATKISADSFPRTDDSMQVRRHIQSQVKAGVFRKGQMLPTPAELSKFLRALNGAIVVGVYNSLPKCVERGDDGNYYVA